MKNVLGECLGCDGISVTANPQRLVMCVNDWPEDGEEDFIVFPVRNGESDEEAINRAVEAYGPNKSFYIK